jgi:hypothetical protein
MSEETQIVPTKVYECMQDFVLPSVKEDGTPDGEVSYTKGQKYEMPEAVAKLAPEGSLVEFTPPAPETPKPAPKPAVPWVGGHVVQSVTAGTQRSN